MLPEILKVLEIPKWKKLLMQHQGWSKYMAFQSALEGLRTGEADPQQVMKDLTDEVKEATDVYRKAQGQEMLKSVGKAGARKMLTPQPPAKGGK
jgi:hypothetical protein